MNPFHPAYAPRTCNTWIDELIGRGCFRRAAFALARGCLPATGTWAYGKLTLPPGCWETAGSPASRCPEPAVWGDNRQEMTDLTQPGRGQYSFLMSK